MSQHSCELLQSDNLELQRMAVSLLAEAAHADPAALDRLWELHRAWLKATEKPPSPAMDAEYLGPTFRDWMASDEALRNCVRDADAWLERVIRGADASTEPVHTLVFLILRVGGEKAAALWRRLKSVAFEKVQPDHERCLAVCLLFFNDTSRPDWLVARANAERDLLGPMARKALAVLHPELALQPLPPADEPKLWFELYGGRAWWVPGLLLVRPEALDQLFFSHLAAAKDTWLAASMLHGQENRVSVPLLEYLLDATENLLEKELEKEKVEGPKSLYRAFEFLERCNRVELLERFWARRGTALEQSLTAWLVARGPEDQGYVDHLATCGQAVLLKISGSGIAELARHYIQAAKTHLGRRDGYFFAYRQTEAATTRVLATALLSDKLEERTTSTPRPLDQREALLALAVVAEDALVVQGVVRWGMQIPRDFDDYLEGRSWDDPTLRPALEALDQAEPPLGAFLALGFSRRPEMAGRLHEVLRAAKPDSDTALACLLALEALQDKSEKSEEAFARGLEQEKTQFFARRALLWMQTPSADQRLLDLLQTSDKEHFLSANLLLRESTRRRAAEILWDREGDNWFLLSLGEQIEHLSVLGSTQAFSFLEEVAFGRRRGDGWGGNVAGAIRGLAKSNIALAYEAARELLKSEDKNERMEAPLLLLQFDRTKAEDELATLMKEAEDLPLLHAVGEALVQQGQASSALVSWLSSTDDRLREGALFAARAFPWSQELEDQVLERCGDRAWDVREAALTTLETLKAEQEVRVIIEYLRQEQDLAKHWCLLDAAVELGYPGVVDGFGRFSWFSDLCKDLPYAMRKHATERLKKRREELVKQLEKKKRGE